MRIHAFGFFITEKLSIEVGYDNFTYSAFDEKVVKIGGTIDTGDFAANYNTHEDVIRATPDFMTFEYTKLNYINLYIK